jgi:hypothetical protein
MTRGNQREDREKAAARNVGRGKPKNDGLTPDQCQERDRKALHESSQEGSIWWDSGNLRQSQDDMDKVIATTNFLRSTWCWYNPCLTPGDTNSIATMILALEK